jgi:hypothetical protein
MRHDGQPGGQEHHRITSDRIKTLPSLFDGQFDDAWDKSMRPLRRHSGFETIQVVTVENAK